MFRINLIGTCSRCPLSEDGLADVVGKPRCSSRGCHERERNVYGPTAKRRAEAMIVSNCARISFAASTFIPKLWALFSR